MGVKEKRDGPIGPALIKFGVALAFSLGGIVYTFFRIRPSRSKPSLPSPGKGSEADSRGESGQLYEGACVLKDISPLNSSSQNSRDGSLLLEVDQFLHELDIATSTDDISPRQYNFAKHEEHDVEIKSLRDKVKILEERERLLEIQLLEYYGLKEQETAVIELQNRLRIHNMEAKLYNLKIESLQSENKRLEAQVADYAEVVAELEAAKAKIRSLRKKLRTEAEQNKEQLLKLQERVMKLHGEEKNGVEIDQDLEMQIRKMKELEEEIEEMKKLNDGLKMENRELAQKLEYVKMLASSDLDGKEIQALKEESHLLRQQNEDFRNEIEQLKADRCTDIEELVYLRWINACLRYELRNYQPIQGETIARDLSKTLSPRSEKKAKQLILEYANKEGFKDQEMNILDFDCDQWSASYFTDSGEPDDLPMDDSSAKKMSHPTKTKVFAKLMKLLRGKDNHDHTHNTPPFSDNDAVVSRLSSNSRSDISLGLDFRGDGVMKTTRTSSGGSSSNSIDLQGSCSRGLKSTTGESSNCSGRASDDGSLSIFRRIDSITGYNDNSSPVVNQSNQDVRNAGKMELVKYAEALKRSNAKPLVRRRSASYSYF